MFGSDDEARLFMKTLGEVCKRTDWIIHAWVLMSTHYHMLLETPHANLVEGMKWFQGAFTQRMNAMHHAWGHLFQGRYKAKIIEPSDPRYFRKVSSYIHLNPAAAGLLGPASGDLRGYGWSSYPNYAEPARRRPEFLHVGRVLDHYGLADTPGGRKQYLEVMQQEACRISAGKEEFYTRTYAGMDRGWAHGSREFKEEVSDLLGEDLRRTGKPVHDREQKRDLTESAVREVVRRGCALLEVEAGDLVAMRKAAPEKMLLACYIKENFSIENSGISRLLHMGDRSQVGRSRSVVSGSDALSKRYRKLKTLLGDGRIA